MSCSHLFIFQGFGRDYAVLHSEAFVANKIKLFFHYLILRYVNESFINARRFFVCEKNSPFSATLHQLNDRSTQTGNFPRHLSPTNSKGYQTIRVLMHNKGIALIIPSGILITFPNPAVFCPISSLAGVPKMEVDLNRHSQPPTSLARSPFLTTSV